MQAPVAPILHFQKRRMTALLGDAPALHHQNAVGIDDGCEAMRDHQRGAALRKLGQRLLDGAFGFRIERRRRFIEDKDGRVLRNMRAMARRCFCPPESFTPRSPIIVS